VASLGGAEGSTVKVVSVLYQKAPFCFFSLDPGANVTKLKDSRAARADSNTGSYISNIAKAMMREERARSGASSASRASSRRRAHRHAGSRIPRSTSSS
jgi:NitT/TauT family transport system substrate-binding protein